MYAVVKTIEESNQLNDYIKAGYYQEVQGACFEQWSIPVQVEGGYAIEIMDFMKDRPVPEFLVNGVEFVETIII